MCLINKPKPKGTWLPWRDEEGELNKCPKDENRSITSFLCGKTFCLHFVMDDEVRNRTLCTFEKGNEI